MDHFFHLRSCSESKIGFVASTARSELSSCVLIEIVNIPLNVCLLSTAACPFLTLLVLRDSYIQAWDFHMIMDQNFNPIMA